MPVPDPLAAACQEAARIQANRHGCLYGDLERILRDAPWADRQRLLSGLAAYHKEALDRIPPAGTYPEARPWVDYVLAYERELCRVAGLDGQEIALLMSLGPYLMFRGYRTAAPAHAAPPQAEKCRTAFLPDTDQGPMVIKNVDDPPDHWRPAPPLPARLPAKDWWWGQPRCHMDGVGSGLHLDGEPGEIFPLPIMQMWPDHGDDVPSALEFLRRYSPFWGGCNVLLFDHTYRALAIEKCSRNFFEVFEPDANGRSHISGMVCRDASSPQARCQKAKRDEYRALYRLPDDGPDATFWRFCDQGERMLVEGLATMGRRPRFADVVRLFWTPYPNGLCKNGYRFHPNQGNMEYTLLTVATLFERRRQCRWQRSQDCQTWPERPEVCEYEPDHSGEK